MHQTRARAEPFVFIGSFCHKTAGARERRLEVLKAWISFLLAQSSVQGICGLRTDLVVDQEAAANDAVIRDECDA